MDSDTQPKFNRASRVRLVNGRIGLAEVYWYEAHCIGKREFKLKLTFFGLAMKKVEKQSAHFAVCLNNDGYKASLEVGKLYLFIPNKEADVEGLIRVIDESREDYAFAASRFHPVNLPATLQKELLAASHD